VEKKARHPPKNFETFFYDLVRYGATVKKRWDDFLSARNQVLMPADFLQKSTLPGHDGRIYDTFPIKTGEPKMFTGLGAFHFT
jgi:hypothetical protein